MLAIRSWRVLRRAALLGQLALCGVAHALSPDRPIDHFVTDSWRTGDGLPELAIEALLETSDGYLWIGTQEGLARFDGLHFTVFDPANAPQLRNDDITMLAEDGGHALWIGSHSGLVMRGSNGDFVPVTSKDGLRITRVLCGSRGADGSVWVGGVGGLAHVVGGRVARSFDEGDGLQSSLVTDLAIDRDGSLWIIARNRLYRLRDDRIERFSASPGLDGRDVMRLFTRRNGQLLVLANAPKIYAWNGERFDAWWPAGVPASERIRAVHEDRDGTTWFATDTRGLFRTRTAPAGGELAEQAFPELRFETLYEDSVGNIWLGTLGRGLMRLHEGSFDTLTHNDGLAADSALSVLSDRLGNVWIGTTNGLTQWSASGVQQFSTANGLPNNHVSALADDREGGLWLGLQGNNIAHLEHGKIERTMTLQPALVSNRVSAMLVDRSGCLWSGTNGGGLIRRCADEPRTFTHGDDREANFINAITEDLRGVLWIGTNSGLWAVRDGELDTNPLVDAELATWSITSIRADDRDTLWIGTMSHGLLRVERGSVTRYGRAQSLPDETINSILADDEGDLWLGSNSGVFSIPRMQIDEIAGGRRERFSVMRFGEADGMRVAETVSGDQPVAWHGVDDRLWFVTGSGIAVVDPKRIRRDLRPLHPIIEGVRANESPVAFAAGKLQLPPTLSRLEIRYTAPDLVSASALQFRYRLSGFDDAWSSVGNERIARYVNVPPGLHRFEVQARRAFEDWNTIDGAVDFYVAPAFYQTSWFLALLGLLFAAALWLLHHLRIRWLRMQSAVADERRRIAGEIHDSLAQGFTAISVQIEAALGRLQRAPDLAVSHLTLAREVAGKSLTEARRSVWNLHSAPPSAGSLIASIRSACEQIVYGCATKLTIVAGGRPWVANPVVEQNVVRIAQEAVSNAVQHGEAAEVQIQLVYRFTQLVLTIIDDGRGFDADTANPGADRGFGLAGMRRRADAMRGAMTVESATGVGTRVRLAVPRSNLLRRFAMRSATQKRSR